MAKNFAEKEIAPYNEEDEENLTTAENPHKNGRIWYARMDHPEEYGGIGMGWM
jgi:glutaryl-CoA dehydrogenase (non-decarboxylating)